MDKDREEFQHDWYAILGCEVGSSVEVIQKAARKLAVKYHPDKTSDPTAPEKFLLIQKAKDILSDESKKKVIDEHFTAVQKRAEYEVQRNKAMDEKRKRFRDALDERVDAARSAKAARTEASNHEDILTRELARDSKVLAALRKQNESIVEQARNLARQRQEKAQEDYETYVRQMSKDLGGGSLRTALKVKWRKSMQNVTYDSLLSLFRAYGPVEELVLDTHKKSTASVFYASERIARLALDAFATSEDYRVSFLHSEKSTAFANPAEATNFTGSSSLNHQLAEEIARTKARGERENVLNIFSSSFTSDGGLKPSSNTLSNSGDPSVHNGAAAVSLATKESDVLQKMMAAAAAKKKVQQQQQQQQQEETKETEVDATKDPLTSRDAL